MRESSQREGATQGFASPAPRVRLTNRFERSFDNVVATAFTCTSPAGIVTAQDVVGGPELSEQRRARQTRRRDRVARSLYDAGHHTTLQHATFQFALEGVSRQFLWSFLHSHPFYNSEQVSQRYVEVAPGQALIPDLPPSERRIYEGCLEAQAQAYRALCVALEPVVAQEYHGRFPGREGKPRYRGDIPKRCQEVARYVLPVATTAYLYHTVSGVTLMRYWRMAEQLDVPVETRQVVRLMVEAVLAVEPDWRTILEEPRPLETTPEHAAFMGFWGDGASGGRLVSPAQARRAFREEFDRTLAGATSALVDHSPAAEAVLASSVRQVLGVPRAALSDDEAIRLALEPGTNPLFGEKLNVSTHSKLTRCLVHAHYTFQKKISHAADSQNQRHRMTPGSRPILLGHLDSEPDFVRPALLAEAPRAREIFETSMQRTWEAMGELARAGIEPQWRQYLLPNATAVRFTESGDLLALHHKLRSRLCYNAQREIWRASLDEWNAIRQVHPRIGQHLGPPCLLRDCAGTRPVCPEGTRYCGVKVWRLSPAEYRRGI